LEAHLQERGVLITTEILMSAFGNFMPIMFVFPRDRENKELLDDAPPGSTVEGVSSQWLDANGNISQVVLPFY
jgi:hypothetical protein